MPINELIAERYGGARPTGERPPQDDGRPDQSLPETTLRTGRMMPPFLHNQLIEERSALVLVATGVSIVWLLGMVR